mmetsp:Transcript_3455/g.6916  ORF Transcript_3455/g.6916 Transcript_3455/m.6916 type:complete len:916 (-) Transcript_3455:40-2787(-)
MEDLKEDETLESSEVRLPSQQHARQLFAPPRAHQQGEMMGPILRRKKVVSLPLGHGGEFFTTPDIGGNRRQLFDHPTPLEVAAHTTNTSTRVRQNSHPDRQRQITPRQRTKQDSFMKGVLRRKQVSLDLLGANDFFATSVDDLEEATPVTTTEPGIEEGDEGVVKPSAEEEEEAEAETEDKKLFLPLRFAPRVVASGRKGGHGGSAHSTAPTVPATIDEETAEAFLRYAKANEELKSELVSLTQKLEESNQNTDASDSQRTNVTDAHNKLLEKHAAAKEDERLLHRKLTSGPDDKNGDTDKTEEQYKEFNDDDIIRATRPDYVKGGILAIIMLALTVSVASWSTHLDEHSFIFDPIGLACVTPCQGNVETNDFFHGHNHFKDNELIDVIVHLDGNHVAAHHDVGLSIEIVGTETGEVKKTFTVSPVEVHRASFEERITVDFDHPHEHHVINVVSTNTTFDLSFTLNAAVLTPLANYSEIIAALVMILVYFFILIEVIHRTLVAIFGSMVAGMFLFAMHDGKTEDIRQLMLHMEWSTLGLLFGMMLLVGELSHTGIFEWCAVRLLMASRGSFKRLIVLLCVLTAVASAFLDNVTTMLLIAPVTIDMCSILDVDPRPYLIGEVILSNIGGTATLIGDPPNIIIGSSFDEIGFVDFILHVLPAIFILCVPVSLVIVIWIYRYYLSSAGMKDLDTDKLKAAYPIYDEPRLLIAGTVTFFVILMFFLHPVHHKDTAWIALVGAFITITFTNPHDVQDALRNHVEWDTLLFFAGLFVLVEICATLGLLDLIGDALASYIEKQPEDKQTSTAITLIVWVSAITSAFLDNIPYTATMIPVIEILSEKLPAVPLQTLAWALSFGACLGGNGTLLGASANIVTAGIATNKGFEISFLNFLYPGMAVMVVTVAISNVYLLVRYAWI